MLHEEYYEEYEVEEPVQNQKYGPGPFRRQCAFCRGTGVHPAAMMSLNHERCPVCQGSGLLDFNGHEREYNLCGRCAGSGQEPEVTPPVPCPTCAGKGLI
jgi:DnaJ-class molecular chaperone